MEIGDIPAHGLFGAADVHYRGPARAAVVAARVVLAAVLLALVLALAAQL